MVLSLFLLDEGGYEFFEVGLMSHLIRLAFHLLSEVGSWNESSLKYIYIYLFL